MKAGKRGRLRGRIHGEHGVMDLFSAEHPAQRRSEKETDRVLQILDDLAVEKLRSRAYEETGAGEECAE